jgi:hypothetical protein
MIQVKYRQKFKKNLFYKKPPKIIWCSDKSPTRTSPTRTSPTLTSPTLTSPIGADHQQTIHQQQVAEREKVSGGEGQREVE